MIHSEVINDILDSTQSLDDALAMLENNYKGHIDSQMYARLVRDIANHYSQEYTVVSQQKTTSSKQSRRYLYLCLSILLVCISILMGSTLKQMVHTEGPAHDYLWGILNLVFSTTIFYLISQELKKSPSASFTRRYTQWVAILSIVGSGLVFLVGGDSPGFTDVFGILMVLVYTNIISMAWILSAVSMLILAVKGKDIQFKYKQL